MTEHRRILSQHDMRAARKAVQFCYLCGGQFSPSAKNVTVEHVLPRSHYPKPPEDPRHRWPVTLYVHKRCEEQQKKPGDDELRTLHRFMASLETGEEVRPGHFRRLRLKPTSAAMGRQLHPALHGIDRHMQFAWHWIRGLHAALYTSFLPQNTVYSVLPPGPCFHDSEYTRLAGFSRGARVVVQAALERNAWDGIECWGGGVKYCCTWFSQPPAKDWLCAWVLVFESALQWSRGMMPPGNEFSWHGSYFLKEPPKGASILRRRST